MIQIDGKYYYSPCEKCSEPGCFGCIVQKVRQDLENERSKRIFAENRIEKELEPRIKNEKHCYDSWVLADTGEKQCEDFASMIDDMIDFVEKNEQYMDWDSGEGNLEEMILYLIHNRNEAPRLHISKRQEWSLDEEKT